MSGTLQPSAWTRALVAAGVTGDHPLAERQAERAIYRHRSAPASPGLPKVCAFMRNLPHLMQQISTGLDEMRAAAAATPRGLPERRAAIEHQLEEIDFETTLALDGPSERDWFLAGEANAYGLLARRLERIAQHSPLNDLPRLAPRQPDQALDDLVEGLGAAYQQASGRPPSAAGHSDPRWAGGPYVRFFAELWPLVSDEPIPSRKRIASALGRSGRFGRLARVQVGLNPAVPPTGIFGS